MNIEYNPRNIYGTLLLRPPLNYRDDGEILMKYLMRTRRELPPLLGFGTTKSMRGFVGEVKKLIRRSLGLGVITIHMPLERMSVPKNFS